MINNSVLISGQADFLEANVRVIIKDDNEKILTDDYITADGWMGKLYPFEKEIEYNLPSSQNGFIEIFEEGVKDNNKINKLIIPVIFNNYINISN
ncbi:Gmad2 immunoglobulin-like domain-containing protein [Patescibacteria group bacterium]|nr:Gmad2 immunoglobulin-like domain-containing protein [Patescibacteria group bacterium]